MHHRSSQAAFCLVVTLLSASALGCGDSGAEEDGGSSGTGASGGTGTGASGGTGTGAAGTGGASGGAGTGASGGAGGQPPAPDYCAVCEASASGGNLQNGAIDETSGLAASHVHPGIFYLHNDSGDSPRFFAIDATGADQGTFDVTGASADDWEDMARGPCDAGSCLFLGDVGDNPENRSSYSIYRVAEPATVGPGIHSVAAEELPFVYPDGSHNCETVLVHPTTGDIYVVTKVDSGPSGLYRFPTPHTPGQMTTLEHVTDFAPPQGINLFTGGDVHPAGHGVLMRTYTHLFFYPLAPNATLDSAFGGAACAVPVSLEMQGETVAWTQSGDGYVTVSEGGGASVNASACPSP